MSECSELSTPECYTFYAALHQELFALLEGETDLIAILANTCALLNERLPDINWVGFYLLKAEQLVLGPFQGRVACSRIPYGKGVCGQALQQQQTLRVEDVHQFAGHIACDVRSRAEIVIPLQIKGYYSAVLDIDSPTLGRFSMEDQQALEKIVIDLSALLSVDA
ncbi:MAG: GAF domain-containing protein [Plesiomonas sp.]|uniref:GAF domain-containing protein n=1 Tax=Plesiomonas sp. TaxID=2486279 RepID=UPI003F3CB1EF